MLRTAPTVAGRYPSPNVSSAVAEETCSDGTMPAAYLEFGHCRVFRCNPGLHLMDQEASRFQVMGRVLWLARLKGVSLPYRIFISLTISVCTGPLIGRGSASRGNDNLITFLQLTTVSHPSCGSRRHVQTALPSSLPTPLPKKPGQFPRWWAEGRVPSQCSPVFPGRVRRAGLVCFFFFSALECSTQPARASCPVRGLNTDKALWTVRGNCFLEKIHSPLQFPRMW